MIPPTIQEQEYIHPINPHKPLNMQAGDLSPINQLHNFYLGCKVKDYATYDVPQCSTHIIFTHLSLFVTPILMQK